MTYSLEIVPISKDSVVCLPKKLSRTLAGISPVCLVYRVTNSLHLIDPSSGQGKVVKYFEYTSGLFLKG